MFTPQILIAEFIISNLDKDMVGGIKADLILLFWITKKKKKNRNLMISLLDIFKWLKILSWHFIYLFLLRESVLPYINDKKGEMQIWRVLNIY